MERIITAVLMMALAIGYAGCSKSDKGSKSSSSTNIGKLLVQAPRANSYINLSNQSELTVSGTCVVGAGSVEVLIANLKKTANCPKGSFRIVVNTTPLADGEYQIRVSQSLNDATTARVSVVKDSLAPTASSASFTGLDSNPGRESEFAIQINGTAVGERVRVFGDSLCATELTELAAVAGATTVDLSIASDGRHDFSVQVEDAAGNTSACISSGLTYVRDRVANLPSLLSLISPASNLSNVLTPRIRVSGVGAGDAVNLYTSSSCFQSDQIAFAQATGSTVDITVGAGELSEGAYSFYAKTSDAAGNVSACSSASLSYTIDRTPPAQPGSITRTIPVASPGNLANPSFEVTGLSAGNTLKIFSNSSCATEVGSGPISGATEIIQINNLTSDGNYSFYAAQQDPAGNLSSCTAGSASYVFDSAPPTLSLVSLEARGGGSVIGVGGTVDLYFVASEPLQSTTVNINSTVVTASNITGNTYRASYTSVPGDSGVVTFSIQIEDFGGRTAGPFTATTDGSSFNFDPANYAPSLSIADQNFNENSSLNYDVNDNVSAGDTDQDGSALTYSCTYDTTVDERVSSGSNCQSLSGLSFNTTTGVLTWLSSFTQSGRYEFKIAATDGSTSDAEIFLIDVNNVNRPPVISMASPYEVGLNDVINIDFYDSSSGDDIDVDGQTVTYSCYYDNLIDGSVAGSSSCGEIAGLSFNSSQGVFYWKIKASNAGEYEVRIEGSDGTDTGSSLFTINVQIDISKTMQVSMVGSGVVADVVSLANDNMVSFNGTPLAGGNKARGELFTVTTSAGDYLECSGGCFAITPIDGTAAWSTPSYASTLLSTYMGRNSWAKIAVSAFSQPATISIRQSAGDLVTSQVIAANTVQEFIVNYNLGALWIVSDADVSAYVSTSTTGNVGTFTQDGRIITAAAREALAFVSGGGGTPSGITTTKDNTRVSAYRNDGTNYIDQIINIANILTVTSSESQNAALSAISITADKPVVCTQHADGDGNNSTPSLPKSMLPNHFAIPVAGDYVSLAAYGEATVRVFDNNDDLVQTLQMTRALAAHASAPYAVSYNPTSEIPAGYRFVCSEPCLGILEPFSSDDETLMTGTLRETFSLTSANFTEGSAIASRFSGNRIGECSGDNDFPDLSFNNVPWGTKSLVLIVENSSRSDFVHLNLFNIAANTNGLDLVDAVNNEVSFATGELGQNGYGNAKWEGPCALSANELIRFKVYALNTTLVSLDNQSTTAFENSYGANILGSTELTATSSP